MATLIQADKRFSPALLFLLFFAAAFIIYYPSLHSGFQMDDVLSISDNEAIKNLSNLKFLWLTSPLRFLTHLTFALNYHFHQKHVFGYHLVNILIHAAASCCVYFFILLTFRTPAMAKSPFKSLDRSMALFAGLIFLTHPVQTQTITYLVQRAASLATFCYLLSLSLYIQYRLEEDRRYYFAALTVCFLAMFTKPIAFTLPIMLCLYEWIFFGPLLSDSKRRVELTPFLACLVIIPFFVYLNLDLWAGDQLVIPDQAGSPTLAQYMITEINVLRTYVRLILFPVNQNFDYDYPVSLHFFEWKTILSLLLCVALLMLTVVLFRKGEKFIAFGFLWFFLTLSVESTVIPLRDVIYEHRLYLPMVGISAVLTAGSASFFREKQKWTTVMTIVIVIFSVLAFSRNSVWKDDLTFWTDVAHKSPRKARVQNNLGLVYLRDEKYDKAMEAFKRALEIDPQYAVAVSNIGLVYERTGDDEKALEYYKKSVEMRPNFAEAINNVGGILGKKGEYDEALRYSQRALQIAPTYVSAHLNLAQIYKKKGDAGKAMEHYQSVIQLDPHSIQAYNGLGFIYGEMGKYDTAIDYYQKALQRGSANSQTLSNLGFIYSQKGIHGLAIQYCLKALQINPQDAEAYNNLGVAYARSGKFDLAIGAFEKAVVLKPDYVEAYTNLGASYGSQGNFEKEIQYYEEALKIKPDYGEALYNLGFSYQEQKNYAKAKEFYQKAYKVNPGDMRAFQALQRLETLQKGPKR